MQEATFAEELERAPIDVPRGGLLLAREIAYPRLNVAYYLARLDELAAGAAAAVDRAGEDAPQALASFLFEQQRFRGNTTTYGDPRNSFLNEVLERRLGIPITLSVLYVALAQRLGLEAYGINLPGHFIVGARQGADELLLDPFHGGERLTLRDCERLVQQSVGYEGPLDLTWLEPAAPRAILARMLHNLRLIYVQREQWDEALAVITRLRLLQPDTPDHVRDLGLIYFEQGRLHEAAHHLETYLRLAPDTPEAVAIRQNFQPEFARWARLN